MTDRSRLLACSAYGAAVLAALSAAVSAHWLAGGTCAVDRGGRHRGAGPAGRRRGDGRARPGRGAGARGRGTGPGTGAPPAGRRLQRLVGTTALLAGGVLTLYGGVLVTVGALALTGVLGEPADPSALRWHVFFWDPWFLLWGVLLLVAALTRRRTRAG